MNRLKELRHRRYNQQELSEILGVSRSTYTKYETGDIQLGEDVLQKIADLYHVSIDYILGRLVSPEPAELSGIDYALHGELHSLTDDEKQDILDYVRFKKAQKDKTVR